MNNDAGPQKTDTGNYLRRDAHRIKLRTRKKLERIDGNYREQSGAQRN